MKRKNVAIAVCGALLIGICSYGYTTFKDNNIVKTSTLPEEGLKLGDSSEVDAFKDIKLSEVVSVDGNILDYSDSLKEMKQNSDIIVVGKVISQEQFSHISVKSTVSVSEKLKGKDIASNISIFQLGNLSDPTELLQPNKEYTLFLGKQSDDKSDTYYIKGAHQGAFLHDNGKLVNPDKVMKDELKKMVDTSKSIKEYDVLRNFSKNN